MTELGEASFFLGMGIVRDRGSRTLALSQERYGREVLGRFGMESCKPARTPLPSGFKFHRTVEKTGGGEIDAPHPVQQYQSAVGSLMYLVTGTRPDLGFAVGAASRFLTCPTSHQWEGILHVMRYLQGTLRHSLILGGAEGETGHALKLIGYSDADWGANDEERRSISGYSFFLGGGLVSWSSKRQATPALSSTEAEYMALARATKEALWLQRVVGGLLGKTPGTVPIHVDNSSCISLSKNPEDHDRTKHIDIQYHFLRHHVALKHVRIHYCPTEEMVADVMTKGLKREKHDWCVRAMMLIGPSGAAGDEEAAPQEDGTCSRGTAEDAKAPQKREGAPVADTSASRSPRSGIGQKDVA